MPSRFYYSLVTLLLLACLQGCGQKGSLYLPDEEPQQQDNGSL